jgi:uncharacterized protein YbjQ (UPF0145 family)
VQDLFADVYRLVSHKGNGRAPLLAQWPHWVLYLFPFRWPPSPVTVAEIIQCLFWRKTMITLTTAQALDGYRVTQTLEVITAECVFGMNFLRDFFSSITDFFGGRSSATQKVLKDARKTALEELRKEAAELGASAVIGVRLDYSEFSGGGKSMLFLVASGTAVVVEPITR